MFGLSGTEVLLCLFLRKDVKLAIYTETKYLRFHFNVAITTYLEVIIIFPYINNYFLESRSMEENKYAPNLKVEF